MGETSVKTISVKGFLLKIIIWLPVTFVAWYFLTPVILYIVSYLVKAIFMFLAPHAVLAIEQQGHLIEVVTKFAASEKGKDALTFTVNGMKYGYGIALFFAILLTTPDKLSNKIQNLYVGFLILIIVQVWGVTFDMLVTFVFKLGRGIGETMGTTEFTRELIALGYQMGYLILPSVTPILLWFTMYQQEVVKMAPKFAQVKKKKKS